MENNIYLCDLYEYYKGLLTDKQQQYFEDYYFDNLTQEEIAENNKVSKNAVSKSLIEIDKKLEQYESILKLYDNKVKISNILSKEDLDKIEEFI